MFTDGKDRFYENLMQQTPSRKPKHSGKQHSKEFQYKYADLSCEYCPHNRKCKFELCPYIMEYLDGLLLVDNKFPQAIQNAETCENGHWRTLLYLKGKGIGASMGVID
jgi:hypothetical protein